MGGITDAQDEIPKGSIIPQINESSFNNVGSGITSYQTVEFEVSVTANEREGSEAKLNVVAAFVGGGVSGNSGNEAAHAAKLLFKVPVKFPRKEVPQKSE
jgi:hypothetical protein